MKFLVTVTPRTMTVVPPQAAAGMLSAQRDWLNQRVADGTFDCVYGFITGGGCAIANVDSHEELNKLLFESPAFPIGDYEARAVSDVDSTLGTAVAMLERAAQLAPQPAG